MTPPERTSKALGSFLKREICAVTDQGFGMILLNVVQWTTGLTQIKNNMKFGK
jgi:hypothetical protein